MFELDTKIVENIGIVITAALAILFNYLRKKSDEKSSKDVDKGRGLDLQVDTKLAELRVLFNADRAKLFQFHNGGKYFNGQSIKKVSLSNCQVSNGISMPRLIDYQNVPTSFLTRFLGKLTTQPVLISKVEDLQDAWLQQILISSGTYQIMAAEIRSQQKETLAILILDWIEETVIEQSDEVLIFYAKQIGSILNLSGK